MATIHPTDLDEVIAYFNDLEDPRSPLNRQHPLVSVVVIALMAVLAGAGGRRPSLVGPRPSTSSFSGCWTCRSAFPARMFFAVS
jgi:DDE_Tnp_1-associated